MIVVTVDDIYGWLLQNITAANAVAVISSEPQLMLMSCLMMQV